MDSTCVEVLHFTQYTAPKEQNTAMASPLWLYLVLHYSYIYILHIPHILQRFVGKIDVCLESLVQAIGI